MASEQCETFSQEIRVSVSAKRMWHGLVSDSHHCLPKAMPHKIEAVEYEGGETHVKEGTIRITKFHKAHHHHNVQHVKEKIVEMDEQRLRVKLHIIEGGFLGVFFHNYNLTLEFRENVVWWCMEYRGLTHNKCPEEVVEVIVDNIKGVEAYLVANPQLYA